MLYLKLCQLYEKLESTSKGLEKTARISEFLKEIKKEPETIYLIQGRILPNYNNKEIGISQQTTIKVISQASGISEEKVVQ